MATKITYTDKVKTVNLPNPANEIFRSVDANELKTVVNSHADDIDQINLDVAAVESDITTIQDDITNIDSSITTIQSDLTTLVPYTGATSDVDLGVNSIKADTVQPSGGILDEGALSWNDSDGTLDLNLKGGNVTLQVGQEEVVRVVNGTGVNLLESQYKVVKIIGAQGQRLQVDFALADSDINSATAIGIVTENINNNQEGFITTIGAVRGINTTGSLQGETWDDGDVLYLSPTVEGGLTNIKPLTPAHMVVVGFVEYAHAVNGKIYVKVDNGYEIEELHDVLITSLSDNELLQYNSAEGYWENRTLAEAGIQPLGNYLESGDNVSELINDAGYLTSAPVDSVAGKTGVVTLVKADITDFSDADYATAAQGTTADNSIQKNIGATYTTNALTAVTQAEYDALTPDATTIYFIV